jgi:hypothetical protein
MPSKAAAAYVAPAIKHLIALILLIGQLRIPKPHDDYAAPRNDVLQSAQ